MIQVINDYDNFWNLYDNSWSGAIDTLDIIKDNDKERDLMDYLESMFYEPIGATELNDFLWFDRDTILEDLGIPYED